MDWTNGGTEYVEDVPALWDALQEAEAVTDRPSMILLRTVIAWPAPNAQGTGASHGSALGADEVAATKQILGFDPEQHFEVPDEVLAHTRGLVERGQADEKQWREGFDAWAEANTERKALLDRLQTRTLPAGWDESLPVFEADPKGVATRKASGGVLAAIAPALPELWGGSADLAESNNTTPKGEPSFVPEERSTTDFQGDKYGRVLHFGIREHAMGSIMNGIALHGGTRVYGGTFLVFSDYMRPAVRLAALMQLPVTYVWTHDSIGLGEDGPTHQPVEHLAALRAIPGLDVVRPADANETVAAWRTILEHDDRPAGLALTRQNVPTFPRGEDGFATTEGVARGGYVLIDAEGGTPDVVLVGTGSEVQLAVEAAPAARREGRAGPRRVDAVPRVVRRAGPGLPRLGHPAAGQGPGQRRGRRGPGLARGGRRPRPDRVARPLRCLGRLRHALPAVRDHRGGRRPGRRGEYRLGQRVNPGRAHAPQRSNRHREEPMSERLKALADAGVSIWLDDLSRERIETGNLAELVKSSSVVGVTTNPTIFAAALSEGERYDDQVTALAAQGTSVDDAVFELTTHDVREACDLLLDTWKATDGVDGRVSIEVPPGMAFDTDATVVAAKRLWGGGPPERVHQDPGDHRGPPGDHPGARRGHQRQRHADLRPRPLPGRDGGLRRRARAGPGRGVALHDIHSVASFFVSRVDTEIDKRLDAAGGPGRRPQGQGRRGQRAAGLPGLRGVLRGPRFQALKAAGAQHPAAAVGVDRREEPGVPRHHVRRRPRRRRTP